MIQHSPHVHKVQYYETDQMGFAHHSNYIRWMEEARMHYLDEMDLGYREVEQMGILCPLLSTSCTFKETTTFADVLSIETRILKYSGVRLIFGYTIRKEDGAVAAEGTTEHCFMHRDHSLIRVKREFPDVHAALAAALERDAAKQD